MQLKDFDSVNLNVERDISRSKYSVTFLFAISRDKNNICYANYGVLLKKTVRCTSQRKYFSENIPEILTYLKSFDFFRSRRLLVFLNVELLGDAIIRNYRRGMNAKRTLYHEILSQELSSDHSGEILKASWKPSDEKEIPPSFNG